MADNGAQFTADELPDIPVSWQWGRLGDLVDQSRGICYGIVQPGKHDESGVPMVNSQDVLNGTVASRVEFRVAKELHARFKRSTIRGGEVLLTLVGANFGRVAIAPSSFAGFNCSRAVGIIPVLEHPQFVMFCLRSPLTRRFLDNWANTTAQPTFNLKEVANLPIPLPPLVEQKRIAEVLGALDDKIELNRRMNATLEATARALFQSWFVDFDPIRDKLDGRTPSGMDASTAALFPDSFEESELGHIPKGWEVGRVSDVSEFSRSSINPGEFPEETFDHYSLPAFDEGRTPKVELGIEIMSNKLAVTPSSVLLSKLNPHIPRIWLPDLHETHRSVCSTEFIVASTRSGFSREFIYSLFTNTAFASTYGTLVTGTTGSHQRIRPESVLEMKTIIPTPPLVEAFTHLAKPMFDQINRNIDQSRTLATLRDTLLPKLLSGELSLENTLSNSL